LNLRSFISVDVSIKDTISDLQNKLIMEEDWNTQQFKPVEKQNLHFSIIFLGEITPEAIGIVMSRLSGLRFQPFRVVYKGLGVFPSATYARVLWMGTDLEGGKKLTDLSQKVVSSIKDVGFTSDKPFIPHVTLFRLKDGKLRSHNMLTKYYNTSFGSDLIDRIHLKRSQLTQTGPIYSSMFTIYGK
jgi:RNA 2',3'-cyclic 3'-phosphodiesterase